MLKNANPWRSCVYRPSPKHHMDLQTEASSGRGSISSLDTSRCGALLCIRTFQKQEDLFKDKGWSVCVQPQSDVRTVIHLLQKSAKIKVDSNFYRNVARIFPTRQWKFKLLLRFLEKATNKMRLKTKTHHLRTTQSFKSFIISDTKNVFFFPQSWMQL